MTLDTIDRAWVDLAAARLGPPIFTNGSEVRFNCFRDECGSSGEKDTHFHMYVNPARGKFFCQRCQKGGTLEYLTTILGIPLPDQNTAAWASVVNDFLFPPKRTETSEDDTDIVLDDPPTAAIVCGTRAYTYVAKRGISEEQISRYGIRMGLERLRNRIVFPDCSKDGKLLYWVARDYAGRDPKYKNAMSPRRRMVYNLGRLLAWFSRPRRVVICEGVISAISAGYDAVATYGKYVTADQIQRLKDAGADEYIVAFDGDATEYGVSLASRLHKLGCDTRVAKFPDNNDPNDLGRVEARLRINDAFEFSNDFDAVRVLL